MRPAIPAPNVDPSPPAPRPRVTDKDCPFYVPPFLDAFGWLVDRYRAFWLGLGRLESSLLAQELRAVSVTMPIYVCGLARAGTTLLHEIAASPRGVASHRIKDYPMVYTPYWWRQATAQLRPSAPRERVHRDKVLITPQSPDAFEEMLWMAFFPHCHDPSVDNRLTADSICPKFETFYDTHLRKLLLAEQATRYVAKANYHVARLPYLVRLFPDAKFVLAVRAPAGHIASLLRQHQWFSQGQRKHPRALTFMQRSGHFEFGRDRRPMNLGDGERVQAIRCAWAAGEEVRGWACYWDMVYGHLARLLDSDAQVRAATRIVRFEDLCATPAETVQTVLRHCELPDAECISARFAPTIRFPDYYASSFSPAERAVIQDETARTASQWGY